MNKKEYKEFEKRYDKFKKNNLPTSFWDDERQTLEYVYYDTEMDYINTVFASEDDDFDRRLHIDKSLVDALGDISCTGFYYPYTCKYFTLPREDEEEPRKMHIKLGHTHDHYFEHVVSSLYDFPESFKIEDNELEFYSKQQLEYLRRVQKYLLFLGLKDIEEPKARVGRFRNKRQKKYGKAYIRSYSDKSLEDFLSGKRNFTVRETYKGFEGETFKHDYFVLFTDMEDNFKMYVRFIRDEEKRYKDIKEVYQNDKFKDDDKVILTYFEILEKF